MAKCSKDERENYSIRGERMKNEDGEGENKQAYMKLYSS
jgi:hypothetical protein